MSVFGVQVPGSPLMKTEIFEHNGETYRKVILSSGVIDIYIISFHPELEAKYGLGE